MKMKALCLPFALLMIATIATAQEPVEVEEPVQIQVPKTRNWLLRFGFVVADTSGQTSVGVNPGNVVVGVNGGGGGFIGIERRASPLVGVDFSMTGIGTDMNISTGVNPHHAWSELNIMAMSLLTLGVNFHFVNEGPIDVYAGPLLSFNRYSNVSVGADTGDCWWWCEPDHAETVWMRSDSEFTWGARAGLDIPLGKKKKWTLGCSLTYIDATYEFEPSSQGGPGSLSLDPLMFSFGAGLKF